MRNSSSRRAALLATTASLLLVSGRGIAQERPPDAIDALLLASNRAPERPGLERPEPDRPRLERSGDTFGDLLLAAPDPAQLVDRAAAGNGRLIRIAATGASGRSSVPVRALAYSPPDPQTLLLLFVQLDNLTLTEGMAAYGLQDDPQIPVGELSRLLELDIQVMPSEGRIVGNIGEARRALVIDLATSTARIGPTQVALAAGDVAVSPTEIYVRASVLSKLLPLKFEVNSRALSMKITASELLPIQGRLQRVARLRQATPSIAAPVLRVETPYRLFTPPSVDVALGIGAQTISPRVPSRYDVRLGGDLLYAGLQAYFGSDETGRLSTARVLLERRSLEGNLLGPLHARSIGIGDVFTPGLAIGPRSFSGRGIAISTVPLDQTNVFNRIDLRGELQLGDDVELYVNDVLQGGQTQSQRGQYEFLNVALTQGVNVVRIVTYGPRGQRKEETRIINVSGGLLRRGETTFAFGAIDQDEPLLRLRDRDPFAVDRSIGKRRVVAQVNYGLSQYLTLTGGGSIYTDQLGVSRQLYGAGLRASVAGFATQLDAAADNRNGSGLAATVAGRILGANIAVRHAEYRGGLLDENNPEAGFGRPLDRRSEVTVDQNILFAGRVVPVSLRAVRDSYSDGGSEIIGQARGSASLGSVLFSTGLEYDRNSVASGAMNERLRGFLSGSTFKNYQWQVRATLDYNIIPDVRVTGLGLTLDKAITDTWLVRFAATQRFDAPNGLELIAGTTTRTKYGDLTFTGQYDTVDSSWRLGAQMNFGLGYNPVVGQYQLTRPGPGSGGSLAFHAFIDANGDGQFNPGERPVSGVILQGGEHVARTGVDGRAYLSGFGTGPTARVLVGINDIDNTAVKTPPVVVEFAPRPGGVTQVEYPMRPTGEVLVTVRLRRPDGQLVGLSAVRIRLVDNKGAFAESVTEFDGSANFLDLPATTYQLQLDTEQATRLRMKLLDAVSVTIKPDGSFTPDASAEVRFEPRAAIEGRPPG